VSDVCRRACCCRCAAAAVDVGTKRGPLARDNCNNSSGRNTVRALLLFGRPLGRTSTRTHRHTSTRSSSPASTLDAAGSIMTPPGQSSPTHTGAASSRDCLQGRAGATKPPTRRGPAADAIRVLSRPSLAGASARTRPDEIGRAESGWRRGRFVVGRQGGPGSPARVPAGRPVLPTCIASRPSSSRDPNRAGDRPDDEVDTSAHARRDREPAGSRLASKLDARSDKWRERA
jgi:hypothetical protein